MNVELSEEALAHVSAIDEWWRTNRPAAPDLFTTELESALATLARPPALGTAYEATAKGVRRMLLRRTHYHVYYVEQGDRRLVVAVWSTFRGRAPSL